MWGGVLVNDEGYRTFQSNRLLFGQLRPGKKTSDNPNTVIDFRLFRLDGELNLGDSSEKGQCPIFFLAL
jgi:hypothetical protein